MSVKLVRNAYGKSLVRLTKITRHPDRHELLEASVDIELQGGFETSYTRGDNRTVIPTDTMKNTVYALARQHPTPDIETLGLILARHFLHDFPHVSMARIDIRQQPWKRIKVDGGAGVHPHAFTSGGSEQRTTRIVQTRQDLTIESGLDHLVVLKTTDSGFSDFYRDRYTTLKDTDDRIFATSVKAVWLYDSDNLDFNRFFDIIRRILLETFAHHKSLGVQQTLYDMGKAVLDQIREVSEITLTMPNQHRLLVNLEPFGLTNNNEIFVPTDEPHGLISGTVTRE